MEFRCHETANLFVELHGRSRLSQLPANAEALLHKVPLDPMPVLAHRSDARPRTRTIMSVMRKSLNTQETFGGMSSEPNSPSALNSGATRRLPC